MPVPQTLTASRNATWAPIRVGYSGPTVPLEGAHIAMQLRPYGGAPGAALLTLSPIEYTDEHVSGTVGADDEVRALTLYPAPAAEDVAALPSGQEPGDPAIFEYDVRITYADGPTEVPFGGDFVILPGVTLT